MYYLDSSSSQGLRKRAITPFDLFRMKGESVILEKEVGDVEAILELYDAKILFIEEVCDTLSYYCYTEKWSDGITLDGATVNLHIAVNQTQCAVGTPIIFGGF